MSCEIDVAEDKSAADLGLATEDESSDVERFMWLGQLIYNRGGAGDPVCLPIVNSYPSTFSEMDYRVGKPHLILRL
ncbi:hypothetical protein J6590_040276 [Homalodisca vitripennis]|nr:hypothetical protein J6590_040276 [Homalodisca vitripennis]